MLRLFENVSKKPRGQIARGTLTLFNLIVARSFTTRSFIIPFVFVFKVYLPRKPPPPCPPPEKPPKLPPCEPPPEALPELGRDTNAEVMFLFTLRITELKTIKLNTVSE